MKTILAVCQVDYDRASRTLHEIMEMPGFL